MVIGLGGQSVLHRYRRKKEQITAIFFNDPLPYTTHKWDRSGGKNICPDKNIFCMTSKMLTFWSKSDLVCVKRVLINMATVPLMLVGPGVHCWAIKVIY